MRRICANCLRRAVELAQPNLRKYVRMPRKGRIVTATRRTAPTTPTCKPLTNDGSPGPERAHVSQA
jgi:hypothetical protein